MSDFRWYDRRALRRLLDEGTRFVAHGYPVKFATQQQCDSGQHSPEIGKGLAGFCHHGDRYIWLLQNALDWLRRAPPKNAPPGWRPPSNDVGARESFRFTRYILTHERMHERVTGRFDCANKLEWFLVNILEDERIERAASRKWSRAHRFISQGNKLALKYMPELSGEDDPLELLDFIKLLPFQLRTGVKVRGKLHPNNEDRFALVADLVLQAWEAENTQEVNRIAKEILKRLGLDKQNQPGKRITFCLVSGGQGNKRGESEEAKSIQNFLPQRQPGKKGKGKSQGKDKGEGQAAGEQSGAGDKEDKKDGQGGKKKLEELLDGMKDTEALGRDRMQERGYGSTDGDPDDEEDQMVVVSLRDSTDYSSGRGVHSSANFNRQPYIDTQDKYSREIGQLKHVLLPPKLDPLEDEPTSTRGRLKFKQYRRTPDTPFLTTSEELGIPASMDIEILVDRSGSMGGAKIEAAREMVLVIMSATHGVPGTRTEVHAMPGDILVAKQEMPEDEKFSRAMGIPADSGTFFSEAVKASLDRLAKSKSVAKLLFVVCDGETDQGDAQECRKLVEDKAKKLDVDVYAIGLELGDGSKRQVKDCFGEAHYLDAKVENLSRTLNTVVRNVYDRAVQRTYRS